MSEGVNVSTDDGWGERRGGFSLVQPRTGSKGGTGVSKQDAAAPGQEGPSKQAVRRRVTADDGKRGLEEGGVCVLGSGRGCRSHRRTSDTRSKRKPTLLGLLPAPLEATAFPHGAALGF